MSVTFADGRESVSAQCLRDESSSYTLNFHCHGTEAGGFF